MKVEDDILVLFECLTYDQLHESLETVALCMGVMNFDKLDKIEKIKVYNTDPHMVRKSAYLLGNVKRKTK